MNDYEKAETRSYQNYLQSSMRQRLGENEFVAHRYGFHEGYELGSGNYMRNLSQVSANCDKLEGSDHFAGVSKMMRLQVAAAIVPGIISGSGDYFYYALPGTHFHLPNSISRKCPEEVARVAFIFADALIVESQKGGQE